MVLGGVFGFFSSVASDPTFSSVRNWFRRNSRNGRRVYILMLNLIGLGFGITAGGIGIDMMKNAGYETVHVDAGGIR